MKNKFLLFLAMVGFMANSLLIHGQSPLANWPKENTIDPGKEKNRWNYSANNQIHEFKIRFKESGREYEFGVVGEENFLKGGVTVTNNFGDCSLFKKNSKPYKFLGVPYKKRLKNNHIYYAARMYFTVENLGFLGSKEECSLGYSLNERIVDRNYNTHSCDEVIFEPINEEKLQYRLRYCPNDNPEVDHYYFLAGKEKTVLVNDPDQATVFTVAITSPYLTLNNLAIMAGGRYWANGLGIKDPGWNIQEVSARPWHLFITLPEGNASSFLAPLIDRNYIRTKGAEFKVGFIPNTFNEQFRTYPANYYTIKGIPYTNKFGQLCVRLYCMFTDYLKNNEQIAIPLLVDKNETNVIARVDAEWCAEFVCEEATEKAYCFRLCFVSSNEQGKLYLRSSETKTELTKALDQATLYQIRY